MVARLQSASGGRMVYRQLSEMSRSDRATIDILLLGNNSKLSEVVFGDMPRLKLLQTKWAGVDSLDFSKVPLDVVVCSNAGAYAEQIAEHAFGMILALGRNMFRNNERLKAGFFDNSPDGTFFRGRTIGVVGAGGIGRAIARVAKAFSMVTYGINSDGRPVRFFDKVVTLDHLDELLRESDVLVIAIPLTRATMGLIDASKLDLMKEDAILINVARGAIVDEEALYNHLKAHSGFKAGVDVWWHYPKEGARFSQDFPFFELPNFLGSPHNADAVPESFELSVEYAVENIERYLKRRPLQRVVDREDYDGLLEKITSKRPDGLPVDMGTLRT